MQLLDAINQLYYDLTLNELRLMNDNTLYPNISYNSLLYLDLISYKENCTASYLAEALHISKSAVTVKVNELIRQGLVRKTQSETDRRIYYLSITPEVEADYRQYDKRLLNAVQAVSQQYPEEELDRLCRMLDIIRVSYLEEPE